MASASPLPAPTRSRRRCTLPSRLHLHSPYRLACRRARPGPPYLPFTVPRSPPVPRSRDVRAKDATPRAPRARAPRGGVHDADAPVCTPLRSGRPSPARLTPSADLSRRSAPGLVPAHPCCAGGDFDLTSPPPRPELLVHLLLRRPARQHGQGHRQQGLHRPPRSLPLTSSSETRAARRSSSCACGHIRLCAMAVSRSRAHGCGQGLAITLRLSSWWLRGRIQALLRASGPIISARGRSALGSSRPARQVRP